MVNVLLPGRPGDPVRVLLLAGNTGAPVFGVTSSVVIERWYEQIMRLAAFGGALIYGAGAHASSLTAIGSARIPGIFLSANDLHGQATRLGVGEKYHLWSPVCRASMKKTPTAGWAT